MPKKAHPPRGNNASKQPIVDPNEPIIEFTNDTGDRKKSKKSSQGTQNAATASSSGKGETKGNEQGNNAPDNVPKKPDTRTLIGGASWTGKLPVNMLSEHCQKQKWLKPEYTVRPESGKGFVSSVILKYTNPKTKSTISLPPFRPPVEHKDLAVQPTSVEARHFAATYALFCVANMKNLHMMMPPVYRDLWKGVFQEIKKEEESKGRGWMFAADPFAANQEREKAMLAKEKHRLEQQKERERRAKEQGPGLVLPGGLSTQHEASTNRMKGWTKAPKVDMGRRTRQTVERLLREQVTWNLHGIHLAKEVRAKALEEISQMGFRKSHVEEALDICKDKEEAVEWLLVHIPEDDLPRWAMPDQYVAGIAMASNDLKREAALKRLSQAGYSVDLCDEVLSASKEDECIAAAVLQSRLIEDDSALFTLEAAVASLKLEVDANSVQDSWLEEQGTLEAIYGDRYSRLGNGYFSIVLEIPDQIAQASLIYRNAPGMYPNVPPLLAISSKLPAYIRLSIVKRALAHARKSLLCEPMVFNIVDWLENNIGSVIESPGRLSEVSSAATSASDISRASFNGSLDSRKAPRVKASYGIYSKQNAAQVLRAFKDRVQTSSYQKMLEVRKSLPAWKLQDAIVDAVDKNPITIISGETGSGKSTQSVQFILDNMIERGQGDKVNIVCTQPRRISAMGLADRVADERSSAVGDEVGYTIRGESKTKPGVTKLSFVTTGVLLRRLQTCYGADDSVVNALADVSHVVVDEVHERSLDTDFLLALLRNVLHKRKDLKVILMSATLDAQAFESYFKPVGSVAKLEIEGRTHPVIDYWLDDVRHLTNSRTSQGAEEDDEDIEIVQGSSNHRSRKGQAGLWRIDYDLIAKTVQYIDRDLGPKDGAILLFLPGTVEIDRAIQALRPLSNLYVLPLHASLLPEDQRRVFPPARNGKRKIVCATNVAETSITIPDVVAVIDTGRVKETSFDPNTNMVRLSETWASRAACKQRRGRAGRVRQGHCYKLYTKDIEERTMVERPEPEIRRVPLEQLALSVKSMGITDVPGFLATAITPPDASAVNGAVSMLRRIGALDGDQLTSLGWHLSSIPADLRCAKLMVYGVVFKCLSACLIISSVLTSRSPFLSMPHLRDESKAVRAKFGAGNGDLIADLRAYEEWQNMSDKGVHWRDRKGWAVENCLSPQAFNDISSNCGQYLANLKEIGFVPDTFDLRDALTEQRLNMNSHNDGLIRALVAAAFTPQIARIEFPEKKFMASVSGAVEVDPEARTIRYYNEENGRVFAHPGSTIFDAQGFPEGCAFMAYFSKMATSKVFIRELTPFNAYALLLFGGSIEVDSLGRGLVVDGWLRLRGWARIGVMVSRLRTMLDQLLAKKIDIPAMDLGNSEVIDIVRKLVEMNGMDR